MMKIACMTKKTGNHYRGFVIVLCDTTPLWREFSETKRAFKADALEDAEWLRVEIECENEDIEFADAIPR